MTQTPSPPQRPASQGDQRLSSLERWTLGLAAAVIGVSLLALPQRITLGVSIGAGLMCLNAWALRRIGLRAVRTADRPGLSLLLFLVKMTLLLGVLYLVLRYLPVDAIGFIIGVSVFPVAALISALRSGLDAAGEVDANSAPSAPSGDR
jgi:hypothetical protein